MFRSWMPLPLNYLLLRSIATRRYHTTFVVLMCSTILIRRINISTRFKKEPNAEYVYLFTIPISFKYTPLYV